MAVLIKLVKWVVGLAAGGVFAFLALSAVMSIPVNTIDESENVYGINNLHLIDRDSISGFTLYRLGEPSRDDIEALCLLGVEEIAVFSGSAKEVEQRYRDVCPNLKVVYNVDHDSREPLTAEFLQAFDSWIAEAKEEGKSIAFRCDGGSHRTGRVAAYYQMKYRGLRAKDAWDLAKSRGAVMHIVDKYSGLQKQFIALGEYASGQECSQPGYCVADGATDNTTRVCTDPLSGCGWLRWP